MPNPLRLDRSSDERFFKPESMIAAITEFCRETGQTAPILPGVDPMRAGA